MAKGKYKEWLKGDNLILLEAWARNGLTNEQIAHNMGISYSTLKDWKIKHSAISATLKKGKEVVDYEVENALLKRALGYKYEEITRERIIDTGQKKRHNNDVELTQYEWNICLAYFEKSCAYCGVSTSDITKDHLDPLNNGGKLTFTNTVPACKSCNSSKKDNQWLFWYQKQKFYDKYRAKKIMDYINFALQMPKSKYVGELVVTKVVEKEVLPDTTAQIFWLKNRKPNDWRDKKDATVSIDKPIIISGADHLED